MLDKSEVLTRYEVLKRRARRVKQLARIYKDHYWALMEDLRIRYRDYYWEYGKSPFQEDEETYENTNNFSSSRHQAKVENGNANVGHAENSSNPNKSGSSRLWCIAHMCKNKAMPLTKFCHMHILFDTEQKLYKPCNYTVKSSPTGPLICGKPTLRSTIPAYCPPHFQKAEKHVARALKKAGLNVSSTSKTGPKFHVLVAEYVRQIQNKRRAAEKSILENSDIKEIIEI